jgi:DNA ligase 4
VNQWFTHLRRYYNVISSNTCKIFFRLFFPEEDVRRRYSIKETVLARTLATDVFGFSKNPRGVGDARRLMEWSEYAGAVDNARQGCLGVEVEKALLDRYSVRPCGYIFPTRTLV